MALHGDIKVNGETLLLWVAQRVLDGVDDGPNLYSVVLSAQEWDTPDEAFLIEHRYEDGALVLAQLVLAHYKAWMEQHARH